MAHLDPASLQSGALNLRIREHFARRMCGEHRTALHCVITVEKPAISTGCARIAVPAFAVSILMLLAPGTVSVPEKSANTSPDSHLLLCRTARTSDPRRPSVTGLLALIAYPVHLGVARPARDGKTEISDLRRCGR